MVVKTSGSKIVWLVVMISQSEVWLNKICKLAVSMCEDCLTGRIMNPRKYKVKGCITRLHDIHLAMLNN